MLGDPSSDRRFQGDLGKARPVHSFGILQELT